MRLFLDANRRFVFREFRYGVLSPVCFVVERKRRAFWLYEGLGDKKEKECAFVERNGRTIKEAQK